MLETLRRGIRVYRRDGLAQLVHSGLVFFNAKLLPYQYSFLERAIDSGVFGDPIPRSELRDSNAERWWEYRGRRQYVVDDRPDIPDRFRSVAGTYESEPSFVAELSDVDLVGPHALVLKDGRIVLDSLGNDVRPLAHLVRRWLLDGEFAAISDTVFPSPPSTEYPFVFPLVGYKSRNWYYHWIVEYLPKFRALEHYEAETGNRPPLLVEPDPPSWKLESIRLMGYSTDRCVSWNAPKASASRLVLPIHRPRRHYRFYPAPDDHEWMRRRAIANARAEVDAPRVVYVSRSDADRRRIRNEVELLEGLSEFDIGRYVLSELSVDEQVRLFHDADVVVAPHGAGLANILFSDRLGVVEILTPDAGRPHFFFHSSVLGHEYECVVGEQTRGDIVVEPNAVRAAITAVFERLADESAVRD